MFLFSLWGREGRKPFPRQHGHLLAIFVFVIVLITMFKFDAMVQSESRAYHALQHCLIEHEFKISLLQSRCGHLEARLKELEPKEVDPKDGILPKFKAAPSPCSEGGEGGGR